MPRILIVKMGAIGDVIMTLPAARALHEAGYRVDWVCGASVAPLLRLFDWIRVIQADENAILRGAAPARAHAIFDLWRKVGLQPYDICAALYYDARFKLLTAPVRARKKFQLSRSVRSQTLLTGRHHTDEYARVLLAAAGIEYGEHETSTQLAPLRVTGLDASQIPPRTGASRIVLVPAGARNNMRDDALRRWPLASYVQLAVEMVRRGHEVVLAGGPDDRWASEAFAQVRVHDAIGKLSLLETLALMDSADLTVTHDTGPLHLAGMTACAVLALFGPTDPRGRLPQRANCVALWGGEGFACRPCYDGRDFAACASNICLQQVTPAMVLAEAETLLNAMRQNQALLPRVRTPKHTAVPHFVNIAGSRAV